MAATGTTGATMNYAERIARAEQFGEEAFVHVGAPRKAGVPQLGGDERPGRLRGKEKTQTGGGGPIGDGCDGIELGTQLDHLVGLRLGAGGVVEAEERVVRRGLRLRRVCPPRRRGVVQRSVLRRGRTAQDRAAQREVDASRYPDAVGE